MKLILLLLICFNLSAFEMGVDQLLATYYPRYILLLKKIYSDLEIPMNYTILPTPRAISSFNSQRIDSLDAKIGSIVLFCPRAILINPPILENYIFGLWKLNNKESNFNANSKVIGVRGAFYVEVFMKKFALSEDRIIYARSTENAFEMIKAGRADFVISDYATVNNQKLSKEFEFLKDMSATESVHHVISMDLIAYKEKIEKAFKDLKDKGLLDIERYKVTK